MTTTLSHTDGSPVNLTLCLPTPVRHTYNLIVKLCRKHGYAWAHNDYLADRRGCTPRTITNHVRILREAGLIECERVGNERFIRPVAVPKRAPNAPDFLPASTMSETATTTSAPPPAQAAADPVVVDASLVARLQAVGVAPTVSLSLVLSDPQECRFQLQALPEQKRIERPAAWLVMAIRGKFRYKVADRCPDLVQDTGMYTTFKPPKIEKAEQAAIPIDLAALRGRLGVARA